MVDRWRRAEEAVRSAEHLEHSAGEKSQAFDGALRRVYVEARAARAAIERAVKERGWRDVRETLRLEPSAYGVLHTAGPALDATGGSWSPARAAADAVAVGEEYFVLRDTLDGAARSLFDLGRMDAAGRDAEAAEVLRHFLEQVETVERMNQFHDALAHDEALRLQRELDAADRAHDLGR